MLVLYIGDKNISSWSMRPWLALKATGAPFEERLIHLRATDASEYRPGMKAEILAVNPAGTVPVLFDGDLRVWESLAICEYLAERFPAAHLWPSDAAARAVARAVAAEMHAGFADLREELSTDIAGRHPGRTVSAAARADIARVLAVWTDCRDRFGAGGPFLFGAFSIADAFFAPVVTRFRTYGVELPEVAKAYSDAVFAFPPMAEWCAAAEAAEAAAAK